MLLYLSLLICFVTTAFAIDTPNVVARLTDKLSVAYSESTAGTHKLFGGTNSSSSKYDVYFEAQRSSGNSWVTDTIYMVAKGGSGSSSEYQNLSVDWYSSNTNGVKSVYYGASNYTLFPFKQLNSHSIENNAYLRIAGHTTSFSISAVV